MRLATLAATSLLALAACSPTIPDSAAGVGEAGARALPAAVPVTAQSLDVPAALPAVAPTAAESLAAETTAALGLAPAAPVAPVGAPLSALAPAAPGGTSLAALEPGAAPSLETISDEQDFEAVAARETIESDAARLAENRAQYQLIQPTDLPPRPDGSGPSIVAFALATTNEPGQALYKRSFASETRFQTACARHASADLAQEAFLDAGGPERDRFGMDPDGDGFACYWDPRPFRAARGGAPEVVTDYEVIETPGES